MPLSAFPVGTGPVTGRFMYPLLRFTSQVPACVAGSSDFIRETSVIMIVRHDDGLKE